MSRKPESYLGKRYSTLDGYYTVIGYIDKPAIIMKNPITGESRTIVIDCNNHLEMDEISNEEALVTLEGHCLCKPNLLEE